MIAANVEARDRYTAVLTPQIQGLTAAQAVDVLFGIAYKQPSMATYEECCDLLQRIADERGPRQADAVLSRFGVWKVQDLFAGMYEDFRAYCSAILVYGANPYYGWSADNIQNKVRDRWLCYHPDSDDLFELRGHGHEKTFETGEVEDVTGEVEWERKWSEARPYHYHVDNTTVAIRREEEL